jgi:hypothetical protein
VLFRKSPHPRAPYWVSVEKLRVHWPTKFGDGPATASQVLALHARLDAIEDRLGIRLDAVEVLAQGASELARRRA